MSGLSVLALRLHVVVAVGLEMAVEMVVVVMVTPDPRVVRGSVAVPDSPLLSSPLLSMLVVVSSTIPAGRDTSRVTGTTCYPHQRQSVSQCCHRQWGAHYSHSTTHYHTTTHIQTYRD